MKSLDSLIEHITLKIVFEKLCINIKIDFLQMNINDNNKKLFSFLFLLLIFAIIAGVASWYGQKYFNPIYFVGAPYMLTPFLAVCIVMNWKVKKIFSDFPLKIKRKYIGQTLKYIFYTGILLPLLLMLITFILGNVCNLPIFGRVLGLHETIDMSLFIELLKVDEPSVDSAVPSFLSGSHRFSTGLPIMLIASIVVGLLNIPFALGEEVGWRGFMEKYVYLTNVKKYIFIGAVWGVWHAPLILIGFNYGEHNLLGILMMVIACISLSFYFSQALHRTNSLMVPTIMHGLINASSIFLFFKLGNPLLGPRMGIVFVIAIWILFFIDYIINKLFSHEKA